MTTAVRSAEAEDAQPTQPTSQNTEVDAVDEGGRHPSSGSRSRGRGARRRHHSLPRQLLRVFEAAPSRSFVQSGLALRMEPFEAAAGRNKADEVENSGGSAERRRRFTGETFASPRPLRVQGRWNSTLDLPHPDTHPHFQPQPLFDRPLFGSGIPEPLSSYERHVRRAIERHRRAGSAGQLRRYATLADLSDLEAAAAEVERRVNGWDNGSPSPEALEKENMLFLPQPPPPPPIPPRPPPRPKGLGSPKSPLLHLPSRQLQPSPTTHGRRPPPRFSTFDSFEAIKRTITESSSTAAKTSVTISEPASSSRLLEANRWLLDAADTRVKVDGSGDYGSGSGVSRVRARWLAPASASARAALPPPVPFRRNRQRQQPPLAASTSVPPFKHAHLHSLRNPPPHPHPHPHPHSHAHPLSASSGSSYGFGDVYGYDNGGYGHSADGGIVGSRNSSGVFFERESVV